MISLDKEKKEDKKEKKKHYQEEEHMKKNRRVKIQARRNRNYSNLSSIYQLKAKDES